MSKSKYGLRINTEIVKIIITKEGVNIQDKNWLKYLGIHTWPDESLDEGKGM